MHSLDQKKMAKQNADIEYVLEAQRMFPLAEPAAAIKQFTRYIAGRTMLARRHLLLIQQDSKFKYTNSTDQFKPKRLL